MAKKAMRVASNRPDKMSQGGGLPDDFDGTLDKLRFVPWNYGGKNKTVLAVAAHITPDPESELEPFIQYYSAGKIEDFQPSDDGVDPVNDMDSWGGTEAELEDYEGKFAVPVGPKEQMAGGSNWGHFLEAAELAGVDFDSLDDPDFGDVSQLDGQRFHFKRIPQKVRKDLPTSATGDGQPARPRTILVITDVLAEAKPKGKAAAKGGAKSAGKPAAATTKGKADAKPKAEDEDNDTDFNQRVHDSVVAALADAEDNTLARRKLNHHFLKSADFAGDEKKQAIALLDDEDFIAGAEGFEYDADNETFTAV